VASGSRLTGTTLKPVPKARTSGAAHCTVCGSRLSAYNAGPDCYTHTVAEPWKGPGQLPR
jgi:hypothetical protein